MATLSAPPESSVHLDHQALVQRIVGSRAFHRAARLRDFLFYIASHQNQPEALTEHRIGVSVFARPESYNPSDDNIVRASARQLRIKLKEYFESEGQHEPVVLDIPKGAYLPVFIERPERNAPVATVTPKPPRDWWSKAIAGLCAIAAIWLAIDNARLRTLSEDPPSIFGQFLKQSPGPARFVLTDSAFTIMNLMVGGSTTVEEYADRSFVPKGLDSLAGNPGLRDLFQTLSGRQTTSLADVSILTRLLQTHPAADRRIEVRHAKHMQTRDFKLGNFIVTGSMLSNPWTSLFDSNLNFQFQANPPRLVNLKPLTGESAEYQNSPTAGHQWARIALVRNLSNSGSVLLAAGISFESTEGAGEYLLRPDSLSEIRRLLQVAPEQPLPPFELLLKTTVTEGTARSTKVVASRRY